jgi:hypothetical protein
MLVTAEASVNMPTDHDLRSDSLDRIEQFAAADVPNATGVRVEGAVAVVDAANHSRISTFRGRPSLPWAQGGAGEGAAA